MSIKKENLSTVQRLKRHLDKNAKKYYEPIRRETKEVLDRRQCDDKRGQ